MTRLDRWLFVALMFEAPFALGLIAGYWIWA